MFIARCVRWSKDNKYIYNGSDETNVRVWKSRPAEKIGAVSIPVLKYHEIRLFVLVGGSKITEEQY